MITILRRRISDAVPLHFACPMPRRLGAERHADNVGLLFVISGALAYLYAGRGMRLLEADPSGAGAGQFAALAEFDRLWTISRVGLWLGIAGVIVLVASATIAHRARARARRALVDASPARPERA